MSKIDLIACMGGWCSVRDNCGHYHSELRRNPSERLCPRDDVQHIGWVPISFPRTARARADFQLEHKATPTRVLLQITETART